MRSESGRTEEDEELGRIEDDQQELQQLD